MRRVCASSLRHLAPSSAALTSGTTTHALASAAAASAAASASEVAAAANSNSITISSSSAMLRPRTPSAAFTSPSPSHSHMLPPRALPNHTLGPCRAQPPFHTSVRLLHTPSTPTAMSAASSPPTHGASSASGSGTKPHTSHTSANLKAAADESAAASGLDMKHISPELLSRLRDPSLLNSAGLIGGKWLGAWNGATYEVHNPATGKVIAKMPLMRADETKAAVAAAHSVWPEWRRETAKARGVILRRWHDLIMQNVDDVATIMTVECGKPLAEAKAEIISGAASVEWFAEEGRRVTGDVLETVSRDRRMVVLKQPVGVVAAITPWNFPMSMITRKVAPALAAGCTVVLKPAELTPLTAVALAVLAERAGVPDGVLNLVMGDAPAIGHEMTHNEAVRKIGFTGSTAVGKMLASEAAKSVKRISLELGGNAPFIVFEDADLELAAKGAVLSGLRNAGQTCICANRVFVHAAVHDKFAALVSELVSKIKVGDGLEAGVTLGPLISKAGFDKVAAHVTDAVAKGAQVMVGGKPASLPAPYDSGNFFEPTVLANSTIDMRCFSEETFGPLLPLFKFESDDEAVMMANRTEYGLAAYFYTRDLARAWRVAEELEFGMIGLNEVAITSEVAPFGGMKQSGLGREQSKYGLQEFQDVKYVCMGLGSSS